MSRIVKFGLLFLVATLVFAPLSRAQSDRASVVGNVADSTGSIVPVAKIKITSVTTGATFETKTDSNGRYVTPAILKPGDYRVEVSKQGFKTSVSDIITLQVGDVREVNLQLQVGSITETVTVTAAAPLLETETSNRGGVVTGREITELPLKDRNFTQLAEISTPGVSRALVGVLTDATLFNQGNGSFGEGNVTGASNSVGSSEAARFSRSGGASISANGLRPTQNNFSLDGVDNNEPQFGTIGVFPNPDAIQEFKVETSVAKAETGRGGANVNTTYQSGTNQYHGSLFYYGQNDALNATHWVVNRNRALEVAGGNTEAQAIKDNPKSPIKIHEFGFTLGGPLSIPKVYNAENRTFFFFDYLGQRNHIPNPFSTAVPTAKSRVGDFSEFTKLVKDPLTCPANPAIPGGRDMSSSSCQTFPGNVIPNLQSRPDFSKQALAFLALYPSPTVNVTNPSQATKNFFGSRANQETIDAFDVKIDHRLFNNNNLMGRYTKNDQQRLRANFFPKVPTAGFGAGSEVGNTRQVVVTDTQVFKPTLLNEVRFGWTRVEIGILNCGVEGACGIDPATCSSLGIPNCNKGTPATTGGILTGGFGTGEFEFSGDGGIFLVKSNSFYVNDNVTIISGRHTAKVGVEVRPRLLDTLDSGRAGNLKGELQYQTSFADTTTTGNVQADYLLGRPATRADSATILGGDNPFQLRTAEWGFYVQDDFKATSNLTLNLGLRYDLFPPWRETSGRIAIWDNANRTIRQASGSGDRLVDTAKGDIGPRIGFAYNFGPGRKFVARGGYGTFYSLDGVDSPPLINNPPLTSALILGANSAPTVALKLQVFNLTTGAPVASVAVPPVVSPATKLFTTDQQQKNARIEEFNLGIQWEVARNFLFDIGYAGTRSRHLLATRSLGSSNNGLGSARTPTGAPSSTNPNPDTPIGEVIAYENRASGNYDSLQTKFEKRFSRGYEFRLLYTWSHNIDDSTGVFSSLGDGRGTDGGPVNPLNFRSDRGNSSLDRRHIFAANVIYDLPFGRGKSIGSNVSGGANKFIGGWQANMIFSALSGQPFSVVGNSCSGKTRADIVGNPFSGVAPDLYFNPAAFGDAKSGSVTNLAGNKVCIGNQGRNGFYGPGLTRTDLSFFKNTKFAERYALQFGIEFFNVWNQVNHVVPNNDLTQGNPGRFDNAYPPRTIQYRLKFFF